MRFSVLIVLSVLALVLAGVPTAASPQPMAPNGTDAPNATTTPTASTPTAEPNRSSRSATTTPTDTGGGQLGDGLRNQSDRLPNVTVPNQPNITVNVTLPSRESSTPTATPTPEPAVSDVDDPENVTGVRIDSGTVIVRSSFDSNTNMTTLVLHSERPQSITVADQGHFSLEGTVPHRDIHMDAGETTRIKLQSMQVGGDVALSINTREVMYSHYVERGGDGLDILRALSTLQAWGAGLLVAFVWMVIAGLSVLRGEDGSPRRATLR